LEEEDDVEVHNFKEEQYPIIMTLNISNNKKKMMKVKMKTWKRKGTMMTMMIPHARGQTIVVM
jgi:hypothetical protein